MKRLFVGAWWVLCGCVASWAAAAPPGVSLGFRQVSDMTNYVVRSQQTNLIATVTGQGTFTFQPGSVAVDNRIMFPATGVTGGWARTPMVATAGGTGVTNLVQIGSGTPDGTKFLRDDLAWVVPGVASGLETVADVPALEAYAGASTTVYMKGYRVAGDGGQGVFTKKSAVHMYLARDGLAITDPGAEYHMAPTAGNGIFQLRYMPSAIAVDAAGTGYNNGAAVMVFYDSSLVPFTNNVTLTTVGGAISTITFVSAGSAGLDSKDTTTKVNVIQGQGRWGLGHVTAYTAIAGYATGPGTVTVDGHTLDVHIVAAGGEPSSVVYTNSLTTYTSDTNTVFTLDQVGGSGANCRIKSYQPLYRDVSGGTPTTKAEIMIRSIYRGTVINADFRNDGGAGYYTGDYTVLPGAWKSGTDNYRRTITVDDAGDETTVMTLDVYAYGFGGIYFPASTTSYWEREKGPNVFVGWFGATPDDILDDTAGIQAAIDFSTFPNWNYVTTQTNNAVILGSGVYSTQGLRARGNPVSGSRTLTLLGQGIGVTTLYDSRTSGVALWFGEDETEPTSEPMNGVVLGGFTIRGISYDPAVSSCVGMKMRDVVRSVVRDIHIFKMGMGLDVDNGANGGHVWERVSVTTSGYGGTIKNQASQMNISGETLADGFVIYQGNGYGISGVIQGVAGCGLYIADSVSEATFRNIYMEFNATNLAIGYSPAWSWATSGRVNSRSTGDLTATPRGIEFVGSTFGGTDEQNLSGSIYIRGGRKLWFHDNAIGKSSANPLPFAFSDAIVWDNYLYNPSTNQYGFSDNVVERDHRYTTDSYGSREAIDTDLDGSNGKPAFNLWPDGDCEYGASIWAQSGWPHHTANMTATTDTTAGMLGTPCLKVSQTSSTTNDSYVQIHLSTEMVNALNGKQTVFGCWVKFPDATPWNVSTPADAVNPVIYLYQNGNSCYLKAGFGGAYMLKGRWAYFENNLPFTWDATEASLFVYSNQARTNSVPDTGYLLMDGFRLIEYAADTHKMEAGTFTPNQPSKYTQYAPGFKATNSVVVGTGTSPGTTMVDIGPAANTTNAVWINGGVQTGASAPALTISQTHNNAAVGYTTVLIADTNTASAAATHGLRYSVGGVDKFTVNKVGTVGVAGELDTGADVVVPSNFGLFITGRASITSPEVGGVRIQNYVSGYDRFRIYGTAKSTPMGATTSVVLLGLTSTNFTGGAIHYTIADIHAGGAGATNGCQSGSGVLKYTASAYNIGGVTNYLVTLGDSTNASACPGATTFGWTFSALTNYIGSPQGFYIQVTPTNTVVDRATTETCTITYQVLNNSANLVTPQ